MKRILTIILMLAVTVYLAASFTWINRTPDGRICQHVNIMIEDSTGTCFITPTEATALLKRKHLYPIGVVTDSIHLPAIEEALGTNTFIESAECYKTPSGDLCISIRQRMPILRIMPNSGASYYLDSKGHSMPGSGHAAHLPVATGHIDQRMAEGPLYELALLLNGDSFWGRQVEQIHVTSDGELELVPRVGDHILFLGKPIHMEEKLQRIHTFYSKGLSRVGWNKYSRISVEFDNQVICKRR